LRDKDLIRVYDNIVWLYKTPAEIAAVDRRRHLRLGVRRDPGFFFVPKPTTQNR